MGGVAHASDNQTVTLVASEDNKTLTITGNGDLTSKSSEVVLEIRKTLTAESNFSTVIFKSEGEEKCTINDDIVQAVLYTDASYSANKNLETVNFGDVIVEDLSDKTFGGTNGDKFILPSYEGGAGFGHKLDFTIPLTKTADGEMTVPSNLFKSSNSSYLSEPVATLRIPEGYTKIAAKAFENSTNLTNVEFPSSVKVIGDEAFAKCKGYHSIKLTKGLQIIGNCAFYLESNVEEKVLEIPSTVIYMGPGCFHFRHYQDVYYYGKTAPLSPLGKMVSSTYSSEEAAFDTQMLVGNGGFTQYNANTTSGNATKGTANKENYHNGTSYFATLHFRSDIDDDNAEGKQPNAETFTDITRRYITWGHGEGETFNMGDKKELGQESSQLSFQLQNNQSGTTVTPGYYDTDLGSQLIWPSQNQWIRSYVNNSLGLKWDGVTKYEPTLTEDQIALLRAQGFTETGASHKNYSTNADVQGYTEEELRQIAYHGTRQFVLVNRDVKGEDPEYPVPVTDGQRWWTLVVPCDVTKAEVDKVFGEGTHLCLFSKVERTVGEGSNKLHLYFQNDTYTNYYTRSADGTWTKGEAVGENPDAVVLYAHTPYMIYPTKRKDDGATYVLNNYELKTGDALRTVVTATDNTKYCFAGNYRDKVTTEEKDETGAYKTAVVNIPQYTYAFGKKTTDGNSQFWFFTANKGTWKSNKCIVERYDDKGVEDYKSLFSGGKSEAKQISTFGDDETTAIDEVVYHFGEEATGAIYSISGVLVSRDGSRSGLAKGIYVQGGKKFVVK